MDFFLSEWISFFLKKRKEIDYQAFQQLSDNQNSLIEIIQGMPEIKLQGSQLKRRWAWAAIQARLFRAQTQSLSISQYQDAGALSISQLKDIIITFMAAQAVVNGTMTLGMMMAVQYIVGQLNAPLQQLVGFVRTTQDANISLERLGEIHLTEDEEKHSEDRIGEIPDGDIQMEGLSFSYSPIEEAVLKDINLTIPRGKITAIVGTSGSGKTTLIKLLLGFYQPTSGLITVGKIRLSHIRKKSWRAKCGVVMQDGYIFSDTIANNVAESDDHVDSEKLQQSIHTANIQDFIEGLPMGYKTMIGGRGNGISQGQRQRLLIARAVYKQPEFIFLDEATNALDTNNERVIMDNLNAFFRGRTVVIVAHRLSTVMHADQIVVLEKGVIIEQGTHAELVNIGGAYLELVKNQLELGV